MTVSGPLSGLVILDLTRVLAGPYCTMVLADLGARIIKVEAPEGDDSRRYGPFINGVSGYFTAFNRGKESIVIDLKQESDRRVFERLLAKTDVLVENYRPGTMEKLGYGWESLHRRFPGLIYAAASGFGHSGPYANRPAYDMVVQAMGGIMSITGQPGGPPTRVGSSIGDISAGLFTAIGIVSALYERARTGSGMKVDVAMLDCQVAILENAITRYFATGRPPGPLGARHASIAPFAAFAAADGHLVIAAGTDALFVKLCHTLDCPALAKDSRYATNGGRSENVDALSADLEALLGKKPIAHWLDVLGKAGIPCGPINDVGQVLADPQVLARNMVVSLDDPAMSGLRLAGNPIKLSGYDDPSTRAAAPALDADRRRILEDF
jgi:CoA:oxalate CoA-transferase